MNYCGWVGSGLVFLSLWMVGQKKRTGFLVGAVAELFWLLYSIHLGSVELGIMAVLFVCVYLNNYRKWGNEH